MTTCRFNTPAHDGNEILPVRLGLRVEPQLCCAGCRTHIGANAYLRVVERRVEQVDLEGAPDRRRFIPRWVSRSMGKVLDHGGTRV
jgi:hypothetical protein